MLAGAAMFAVLVWFLVAASIGGLVSTVGSLALLGSWVCPCVLLWLVLDELPARPHPRLLARRKPR
jgi:threonine/homoserine/homoserine lactone efflux protein